MLVLDSCWRYHGNPRVEAHVIMLVMVSKEKTFIFNSSKQILF